VEKGKKIMYNILFTASVYKSSKNALRFARSIKHIEGSHICALVSPLKNDVDEIVAGLKETDSLGCRVIVFHSTVDNLYQGRGWGFVWAVANSISAKYLCSGDDDIEFTENSHDIVERLDAHKFSVMTFATSAHGYRGKINKETGGVTTDLIWINGDTMFTHFEDNLKYGVADALLDYPVSFFTEIEYQQRMRCLSNKPLIVDARKKAFYRHHSRVDEEMNSIRGQHAVPGISAGKRLWREKYGIELKEMHIECEQLYKDVSAVPEKMKSHFIFHGLWNDWGAIYERLEPQFELAIDTENL
jgi:hypothetical protein